MKAFPSGQLQRRLHGLETEYGVGCTTDGSKFSPEISIGSSVSIVQNVGRRFLLPDRLDYFLQNGARFYLDTGFHPEYSTPECESIRNVIHSDLAGELLLVEAASLFERVLRESWLIKAHLFKNNADTAHVFTKDIDDADTSYGCHENYTAKRDIGIQEYALGLLPFLVTRQIYTGAGRVVDVRNGQIIYHIGARSAFFYQIFSEATTGKSRSLFNLREESHADADKYRRLHIIIGDSNMAPVPNYLKLGTTAMVISLIEEGLIDNDFIRKVCLNKPLEAVRQIAVDMTCKLRNLEGLEGTLSALDIQHAYFDLAFKHRGIFAPQYQPVLDKWGQTLDTLTQNPMDAYLDIDWVTKWTMISDYLSRNRGKDIHSSLQIDMKYHDIIPGRGLFRGKIYDTEEPFAIDQTLVQRLVDYPPNEERARIRGYFARLMQTLGYRYITEWDTDWPILVFRGDKLREFRLMGDIHGNNIASLKDFFIQRIPPEKRDNPEVAKILQEAFPS